jgi:hypothetical protein
MAVKHWCELELNTNKHEYLNLVLANHGEEDEIHPLTTKEIVKAKDLLQTKNVKHQKRICVFNLLKTQKCYAKMTN